MYDPRFAYYKNATTYYYIYFDNQYYASELICTRHYSRDKELLFSEDSLDLFVESKLNNNLIEVLRKAKKVGTNIDRKTLLFRQLKKEIPKLINSWNTEKEKSYHDLMGKIYEDDTVLTQELAERLERLVKNVKTQADIYPPEIVSLSNLIRVIKKSSLVNYTSFLSIVS